jgi:drug/metabolite transporter (DMT)-like permease
MKIKSSHSLYIFQALFVTLLWSTSWVLIKIGLIKISPIIFAALRYSIAFIILIPFLWCSKSSRENFSVLTKQDFKDLFWLGFIYYFLTQGLQFLVLKYIPAVTASLFLNFSSIFTALLGIFFLKEIPSYLQWSGIIIFLGGVFLFFFPIQFTGGGIIGMIAVSAMVFSNSISSILGRKINSSMQINPLIVTVVSMSIGSFLLLTTGLLMDGLPLLDLKSWIIIIWLALINTALAFTIWNNTLRKLSAIESTMINNTMLIQVAVLAYFFLGETKSSTELCGLVIAVIGILLVNYKGRNKN